jgi:hypothetical protein
MMWWSHQVVVRDVFDRNEKHPPSIQRDWVQNQVGHHDTVVREDASQWNIIALQLMSSI